MNNLQPTIQKHHPEIPVSPKKRTRNRLNTPPKPLDILTLPLAPIQPILGEEAMNLINQVIDELEYMTITQFYY